MSRSNPATPSKKRKRLRSMTPSEAGLNGRDEADGLRSPLAKRKKMVADRGNSSKLKETISLAELDEGKSVDAGVGEDEEDEEDEEEDEEDDFLAREMEEMGEDEDDGDLEEVG